MTVLEMAWTSWRHSSLAPSPKIHPRWFMSSQLIQTLWWVHRCCSIEVWVICQGSCPHFTCQQLMLLYFSFIFRHIKNLSQTFKEEKRIDFSESNLLINIKGMKFALHCLVSGILPSSWLLWRWRKLVCSGSLLNLHMKALEITAV